MPPKAMHEQQTAGRKRSNNAATAASDVSHSDGVASSMIDEADEREQSSSSDAATPLSKKAKHELAALVAAASSSPAAAAAASAVPTPCARLDLDSLSVVLSFLSTRDFLRAVRVSRHWRGAGVKKSAWPAFSLEAAIRQPPHSWHDQFHNHQRRALTVMGGFDHNVLSAAIAQPMWRHATEIQLGEGPDEAAFAATMALLPQFVNLVALTMHGLYLTDDESDDVAAVFNALSRRLLMLGLVRCSRKFEFNLHRLSSLRVLRLGWAPEHSDSLIPLHQLVYLHLERNRDSRSLRRIYTRLGFVIRWLSVHHQLRSLSMAGFRTSCQRRPGVSLVRDFLAALLSCDEQSAANAEILAEFNAKINPQLGSKTPCGLSELSLNELAPSAKSFLGAVPSLTRLQAGIEVVLRVERHLLDAELSPSLMLTLPRLQELRIEASSSEPHWKHLVHCTALRTVRLSQQWTEAPSLSCATLQSLLQAWSPTLEECDLDLEMDLADNGNEQWAGLAACHRLRVLELQLEEGQSPPAGLVAVLERLPTFQSLTLNWTASRFAIRPLPANLLSAMCRSRSFSTLHLHVQSDDCPDFVRTAHPADGRSLLAMLAVLAESEPTLLTTQAVNRVRVVGHHGIDRMNCVHSFRIDLSASQLPIWQEQ